MSGKCWTLALDSSAANYFSISRPGHLSFASRSLRWLCFCRRCNYFALNSGCSLDESNTLVKKVSAHMMAVNCVRLGLESSADKTPTRALEDFEVHFARFIDSCFL